MSGLLDAILVGAGISVLTAALGWAVCLRLRPGDARAMTTLWRAARLLAVAPVLLAPIVYFVPAASGPASMTQHDQLILAGGMGPAVSSPESPASASERLSVPPSALFAWLYGLGAGLAVAAAVRRHMRRRACLRRCRPATRHERSLLEREALALGIPAPEMRVRAGPGSPFLTGWRGIIVMPETLLVDRVKARYALVHELCHLARGDERDRLVGSALIILFWFNWPLRRLEAELDASRELACDQDSLAALGGGERRAYAATLIESMRHAALPVSAFGSYNRRHREMRIKAILSGTRKVRHTLVPAMAIFALAIPAAYAQISLTERRAVPAPVQQIAAVMSLAPDAPSAPVVAAQPVSAVAAEPAPAAAPIVATAPPAAVPAVAPLALPNAVTVGRVSSSYGPRPARPAGAPVFHGGTDIAAPTGTAISAPGAGTVIHAAMGYQGSERWGNTVEIEHGNGWTTLYAHLDAIAVESGQAVAPGQQIGTVGQTGAATGPHVHVELHLDGERVDPAEHLAGLR